MTKHIISADYEATFTIDTTGDSWVFRDTSEIHSYNSPALSVTGDDNAIALRGDMFVSHGEEDYTPTSAVMVWGDGNSLINYGSVRGQGTDYNGIGGFGGDLDVTNYGSIAGGVGIGYSGEGVQIALTNAKGATITGYTYGAALILNSDETLGGSTVTVLNSGTISGDITLTGDHVRFVNSGRVLGGDIHMNGNHSLLDMRGGTFEHTKLRPDVMIYGGDGDNTYIFDTKINFSDSGGHDTVRTSFSYKLAEGLEDLKLIGGKNLGGAGNTGDNLIVGNSANNRLAGGGGDDVLTGGKGRDEFLFNSASGSDTITDFKDGVDVIHIDGFGVNSFKKLGGHIEQHGQDVVISMPSAPEHTITIEGVHIKDLNAHDFMFG